MFYPVVPVPAPRMLRSDVWKQRECVLNYHLFKDEVKRAGIVLPPPPYAVGFHMPYPESYSAKRRWKLAGTPHTLKPDLDNMLKALWDALDQQDQQQWSVWAEKRWCKAQPGITIVPMDATCRLLTGEL